MRQLFGSIALGCVLGCSSYSPPPGGGGPAMGSGGSPAAGSGSNAAPTWSSLYASYLATGTIGHCGDCHTQAGNAAGAYSFLASAGYIRGAQSSVSAVFRWMGGPMPPGGPTSDPQASADIQAWVAAGALEN